MDYSDRYKTATEIAIEIQRVQGDRRIDLWLEYLKYVRDHINECIELIEKIRTVKQL